MRKIWIIDSVKHEGEEIELYGWVDIRRDHGKLIFFELRDRSGKIQLVVNPKNTSAHHLAESVRSEWIISAKGKIVNRPENLVNPDHPTGSIEMQISELTIISEANTPPIDVSTSGEEIGEESRLKYRYLDLRRPRLQKNLIERDKVLSFIRSYLHKLDFVEIETPILTKSTPEGARDYVVPSRIYPGKFYALPQSPQQYKQLLMVAGFERYFQIARCFRDEDTRGDRQPEFTQLDLEMSFVEENDILEIVEKLFTEIVEKLFPEKRILTKPFPRMTYKEVMEHYGSDKPDLRQNKNDPNELAFLFVVDFPMFEWKEEEKRLDAVHHPFTKIRDDEARKNLKNLSKEELLALIASQYDFILNGYEIGGGSIREHDPKVLADVFEIMGNNRENIERQFGHILEALEYGAPPHGGIAPGIDRFMMLLMGEPNIREVIAFPKTGDGRDLMMDSPSEIEDKQLRELHIKKEVK